MVTISEGNIGMVEGGGLWELVVENIEGMNETGVDDRVLSLSLAGRSDEAETMCEVGGEVDWDPCVQFSQ